MKFYERRVQYPKRVVLKKVDEESNAILDQQFIYALLERNEGVVEEEGTKIDAALLESANWRADETLSFRGRLGEGLPEAQDGTTQIVTKSDGSTWIIPPEGKGAALRAQGAPARFLAELTPGGFDGDKRQEVSAVFSDNAVISFSIPAFTDDNYHRTGENRGRIIDAGLFIAGCDHLRQVIIFECQTPPAQPLYVNLEIGE